MSPAMTEDYKAYLKLLHQLRVLDNEVMLGMVEYAPRLGSNPRRCPREGCNGRVFIEYEAHYCLACGWRQEHLTDPFKHKVLERQVLDMDKEEDESEEESEWTSGKRQAKPQSSR